MEDVIQQLKNPASYEEALEDLKCKKFQMEELQNDEHYESK